MSRKDFVEKIRNILINRRNALYTALRKMPENLDEIGQQLADVETRELVRIIDALDRITNDSYGICEDCKKTIPRARLSALPYVTRCIHCQREFEETENRKLQEQDDRDFLTEALSLDQ